MTTNPSDTLLTGRKFDTGKDRWDLVPYAALREIVYVLTFGATKYGPENWKQVPEARNRYFAALQRHLYAWWTGQQTDPETGTNHLAHAGACLLFLLALDLEGKL